MATRLENKVSTIILIAGNKGPRFPDLFYLASQILSSLTKSSQTREPKCSYCCMKEIIRIPLGYNLLNSFSQAMRTATPLDSFKRGLAKSTQSMSLKSYQL